MRRHLFGSLFILTALAFFAPQPSHSALWCQASCTFGSCSCLFCSCGCSGSGDPQCGNQQAVSAHAVQGSLSKIEPFSGAEDGEVDFSSIKITRYPGNGEVSVSEGTFLYFPAEKFTGLDSFTFSACNLDKECDLVTVLVDVQPKQ